MCDYVFCQIYGIFVNIVSEKFDSKLLLGMLDQVKTLCYTYAHQKFAYPNSLTISFYQISQIQASPSIQLFN